MSDKINQSAHAQSRFESCLEIVLAWEGGYSDLENDPGGATNLGVTHITLAEWLGRPVTKADVEILTFDDVRPIYEQRYWLKCRCPELPSGVDLIVFDSAVNQGPGRAVKFLQQAGGTSIDGILGPKTVAAIQSADPVKTLDEITARRAVHYAGLQREFHLGWYRRLTAVHRQALAAL